MFLEKILQLQADFFTTSQHLILHFCMSVVNKPIFYSTCWVV